MDTGKLHPFTQGSPKYPQPPLLKGGGPLAAGGLPMTHRGLRKSKQEQSLSHFLAKMPAPFTQGSPKCPQPPLLKGGGPLAVEGLPMTHGGLRKKQTNNNPSVIFLRKCQLPLHKGAQNAHSPSCAKGGGPLAAGGLPMTHRELRKSKQITIPQSFSCENASSAYDSPIYG